MRRIFVFLSFSLLLAASTSFAEEYFPSRFEWQTISPAQAGFNPEKLEQAKQLSISKTVVEPQDLNQVLLDNYTPKEPNYRVLGPTVPRKTPAGMVLKNGKVLTSWGDTQRVDMTFSVVKSYLSTLVAIALRDGLIKDVHDPVVNYVRDGKFDSGKNRAITWHHLMQQTSDWQGTLWDTPDWADRPVGKSLEEWQNRELYPAGTHFKYNDVRVNLLAYALLQVFREPLPQVLRREVMDKIGASNTWRWHGYHNSWIELDGQKMQSVSGGGHFGGGMFISAEDQARFGLLFLRHGKVGDKQVIPADWVEKITVPTEVRPDYGYMWWLNTNKRISKAPKTAYFATGFGGNYIYVDDTNDLVIVLRWIPEMADVINAFLDAQVVALK
ncbi:serine hydrolase [Paraneptunicella aestuarii]|uniref:serine hydrolase domain-containing protein n=1 Tax=Paraneptunicella aestuarii TaxID=2831148 RepID=UPI001E2FD096|nr:serine hydrolase [Paraneptunicella aestuarii]UAA38940.1 serine hydrolase [Paraneptunicella aestuarii]